MNTGHTQNFICQLFPNFYFSIALFTDAYNVLRKISPFYQIKTHTYIYIIYSLLPFSREDVIESSLIVLLFGR